MVDSTLADSSAAVARRKVALRLADVELGDQVPHECKGDVLGVVPSAEAVVSLKRRRTRPAMRRSNTSLLSSALMV